MSNRMPEEWEAASLRELCTFSGGSAFKEKYQGRRTGEYPFIKVSDMNIAENQRFITKANHWIDQKIRTEAKVKLFPPAAVVFAKVGAALLLNRRRILTRETAIDNNMMAAIPKNDDDNFLYYVLQEVDLGEIVQGGAIPSVNQSQMEDVPTLIPPLPEQKKIAAILSSVDEVIEKTRAQISKLKDLKTGMMQELLTKGIGHAEFKDSPVGRIPAAWDVVALGDTGKWKGGGTPSKSNKAYWSGTIPWVSPKDMKSEFISQTEDHVSESAVQESSTNIVKSGSILIVVRSGILKHTLPVAMAARELTINQDMKALTVHKGFSASYIYQYLLAHNQLVLRATLKAGNTVESIDFSEFSKLLIPCPSTEEQHKIASAVDSVARRIRAKLSHLSALQIAKKALMQDLLTGKVRVQVDTRELA